jgi:hypothetical protein
MWLRPAPLCFACLILLTVTMAGCTSGNIRPDNPLDALSMSDNEDDFVTFAKNNLMIMQAGANNFDQLFKVYNIGTLSGDTNSQKFMQQFRLEYQGIDNYVGDGYTPGSATQFIPTDTAFGKELYKYNLKSEDLLSWRNSLKNNLFGQGMSGYTTAYLYELYEYGNLVIVSYDKGDYVAANKHLADFRSSLDGYSRALERSNKELQEIRP